MRRQTQKGQSNHMPSKPSDSIHAGHRERLRARYAESGADGFFDHELLQLLLTYAVPRKDTNGLAHLLLNHFGSLEQVFCADVEQLMSVDGIGQSTAVFLHLHGDLLQRLSLAKLADTRGRIKLNTPLSAAQYALARLHAQHYETVLAVCLNSRLEVIHVKTLQKGTLTEAPVYPRVIAETALLHHAHSIVLMHNHPSGNPAPSSEDAVTTEAVRAALSGIGVRLNDHLVVGGAFVYSFSAGVCLDLSATPPAVLTLEEYQSGTAKPSSPALLKVMEQFDSVQ